MPNQTVAYSIKLIKKSKKLNEKEKDILARRLKKETLKKIGRRYKVTGERIRQIERQALDKVMDKMYQSILFDGEF